MNLWRNLKSTSGGTLNEPLEEPLRMIASVAGAVRLCGTTAVIRNLTIAVNVAPCGPEPSQVPPQICGTSSPHQPTLTTVINSPTPRGYITATR